MSLCFYHPDRTAAGMCMRCRVYVCPACSTQLDGINHCHVCLKAMAARPAKAPPKGSGWGAVLLLALTFLFYLPAATCLVLLIAAPSDDTWVWRLLLPAGTALLLPLTGLSAGACQEAFYSWAEGYAVSFGECLKASWDRGIQH